MLCGAPVGWRPGLVIRGHAIRPEDTRARLLMQGLKVQMIHNCCRIPGSVEQKGSGSRVGASHNVVHLQGLPGHVEVVPGGPLIPGEHHLLRSLHIIRHNQQATVVADLIHESPLMSFEPRQSAISGDVRVNLVLFKSQGFTHIASAHNDPNRCLGGIERGVVPEIGHPVEVQPALVLRAVDGGPHAVHLRSLEVRPDTAFIECDHCLDRVLIFSLALHPVLLVNTRFRESFTLNLFGFRRRFRCAGILRRNLFEIGNVDPLQIQNLIELAVPGGAPDVVGEGQGIPGPRLVRNVHTAHVISSLALPVVHMQNNGTLGSVQNIVGLLIQIHVQLGRAESLGPIR
mmetsp:Transcript_2619/g.5968  ORF Transcript_2619/g.5968 Transcript_2619/m.5968 type:complete len:344 (-) Transcript_2619:54-1085(-)